MTAAGEGSGGGRGSGRTLDDDDAVAALAQRLAGYDINVPDPLLREALAHPSFAYEKPDWAGAPYGNERLEYLGDAVLELVVSHILFRTDPEAAEGVLTRRRAFLVRTERLAELAVELDLDRLLRLGRGARRSSEHRRQRTLAAAVEALMGAVFVAVGYDRAAAFAERLLKPALERLDRVEDPKDSKSRLQERVQAAGSGEPEYRTVGERGPDHNKEFSVAVYVDGEQTATGSGRSKAQAEQEAARRALAALKGAGEGGAGGYEQR